MVNEHSDLNSGYSEEVAFRWEINWAEALQRWLGKERWKLQCILQRVLFQYQTSHQKRCRDYKFRFLRRYPQFHFIKKFAWTHSANFSCRHWGEILVAWIKCVLIKVPIFALGQPCLFQTAVFYFACHVLLTNHLVWHFHCRARLLVALSVELVYINSSEDQGSSDVKVEVIPALSEVRFVWVNTRIILINISVPYNTI